MYTQRLAGMVGLLAVVILGLVGVDRWNKDAKARSVHSQVVSAASDPLPPLAQSTIHYQVDPSAPPVPQLPPAQPKETQAPPLISTGELDTNINQSLDNLQKPLPKLPSAEEPAAPPPEPEKKGLNLPPPPLSRTGDSKADTIKLPPPPDTTAADPIKLPPPPDGTAKDKNTLPPGTNI